MRNTKGFTLMELMAVVIIIGILASLSIPNLIGYARDARNDRAKSNLYTIAQGYKNFKNDFAWVGFSSWGPLQRQNLQAEQSCDNATINNLVANAATIDYSVLIRCSYINNIDYEGLRYHFYLGNGNGACAACNSPTPNSDLACMVGNDGGAYNNTYCAYIDMNNTLHETAI